jgi:phosphohistidine phosphatase
MDLYIIRHAWAGQFGDPQWPDDRLRPLTPEGRQRFVQVIEKLAARGFAPRLVATSPMLRCRETAEIVAASSADAPQVIAIDALLPGGDVDELAEWTARQARRHEQIAWVGHAPDVGRLAAALIGDGDAWLHFSKGAVAAVRFDGPPQLGAGELRWLVTAKLLDC